MKISQLTLAAALLLGVASCNSSSDDSVKEAQQTNEAKIDSTTQDTGQGAAVRDDKAYDSEFMTKAASGGMLEVELGKVVAQRATTAEAKQFAQQMVTDHTKANNELKALAAKKDIELPASLGDDQKKVYDEVLTEKGAKLDQKYVSAMVDDHEEDVKEFQEASTKAGDPEVKALAAKTLPMLQMHLTMIKKIQAGMDAKNNLR
jgi:putative membrane protein